MHLNLMSNLGCVKRGFTKEDKFLKLNIYKLTYAVAPYVGEIAGEVINDDQLDQNLVNFVLESKLGTSRRL